MKNWFSFQPHNEEGFDPKKFYKFDKSQKAFVIDINLEFYRDIFNFWDFSPWRKRDLDDEFHNYLLDCLREIPLKYKLIISFHLPKKIKDTEKEKHLLKGFKNFFAYCIYSTGLDKKKHWHQTRIYILLGLIFLAGAYGLENVLTEVFLFSILPEGLFIGGWVLLWEACSNIFFKNDDLSRNIKFYKKLIAAEIEFKYSEE